MKELKIEVKVEELLFEELVPEEQELVEKAIKATQDSNAKYSNFNVGAAVRLKNGTIILGANQENASFPLSMCAERTAIFAAQVNYPQEPITCLAICAHNAKGLVEEPVTPCGACRQVMVEVEERYSQPMKIILYGTKKIYRLSSAKDLLPLCFVDKNMK